MSDLKAESNVTTSQKPIPRIKDISMMKAWKDSKVRFGTLLNRSITEMEPVPVTGGIKSGLGWDEPTPEEIPGATATAIPVPSLINSE